jgi:hypothetical protein
MGALQCHVEFAHTCWAEFKIRSGGSSFQTITGFLGGQLRINQLRRLFGLNVNVGSDAEAY